MSYFYRAGETIPLHPNILWRVKSGLLSLQALVNGKPITLSTIGVGEVIGEALVEVSPCYLICITPVKIEIVPSCLWRHLFFDESIDQKT